MPSCATLMWSYERGLQGSNIHGFGDALFFSTAQIVTISSSFKNPVTHAGQIVDVVLELWAIFVAHGDRRLVRVVLHERRRLRLARVA